MKLMAQSDPSPKQDGIYLILNIGGIIGCGLYEQEKWYSLPDKHTIQEDFWWIEND